MAFERTCNYVMLGGFAHAQFTVVIGKLPLPSLLAIGACTYSNFSHHIPNPLFRLRFSILIRRDLSWAITWRLRPQ